MIDVDGPPDRRSVVPGAVSVGEFFDDAVRFPRRAADHTVLGRVFQEGLLDLLSPSVAGLMLDVSEHPRVFTIPT